MRLGSRRREQPWRELPQGTGPTGPSWLVGRQRVSLLQTVQDLKPTARDVCVARVTSRVCDPLGPFVFVSHRPRCDFVVGIVRLPRGCLPSLPPYPTCPTCLSPSMGVGRHCWRPPNCPPAAAGKTMLPGINNNSVIPPQQSGRPTEFGRAPFHGWVARLLRRTALRAGNGPGSQYLPL